MQWRGSTRVGSKGPTGIHAQANRSMIVDLTTFPGSRRNDGLGRTGLASPSVYRPRIMVMIMRPGIVYELSCCA